MTKNLTCSESGILFLRKIPGSGICAKSSSLGYALKRWHDLSFIAILNIGAAKSNFGMKFPSKSFHDEYGGVISKLCLALLVRPL